MPRTLLNSKDFGRERIFTMVYAVYPNFLKFTGEDDALYIVKILPKTLS